MSSGACPLPPLRSLLFLPATSPHLLDKAPDRGADALVVDLEDSVPIHRKAEARALAADAVTQLHARGARVLLRVNAGDGAVALDLAQIPLQRLTAVMLPKVERPQEISALAARLDALGAASLPVAALLESPRGVLAAREIAAHPRLGALGFGAEDHAAAIGVPPTPLALAWAAQQVITCAHAHGLQCWGLADSIAEVDDMAAFGRAVQTARAMGFTGSVCIHPRQVGITTAGFSPTAAELAWARRVITADDTARAAGLGAVLLDGRMVDVPVVERARRWLKSMKRG